MSALERDVSPTYEAALELVAAGISVIPIQPGTKEPPQGFRWGEYTTRIADASELYTWFEDQGWNIAVVCGEISGNLVVVDFDRNSHQDGGFREHSESYPAILDLPRVKTGKGRVHVYCRTTTPTDKYTVGEIGNKVEVRSGNHYCVAPPSIHPETGKPYIWSRNHDMTAGVPVIDIQTIGFELRRHVSEIGEPGTEGNPLAPDRVGRLIEFMRPFWKQGQRHHVALGVAGWLAGYSVPESDARRVVEALSANDNADERSDFLIAVRDTYKRWKAGYAVAGWSMLTDASSPLISRPVAAQLEWLVKDRQASLIFDITPNPAQVVRPWISDAADLLREPDEPDTWLVEGILRDTTINIVVGPAKTYKSFLVMEMGVALATGTAMFGTYPVVAPRPVIYIQEESGRKYVRKRLAAIMAGRQEHPETLRDMLHIITNQRFRLDDPAHLQRLVDEAVQTVKPALIIFDPLREMHWQDENKSETMKPILDGLKAIRDTYNVSLAVVHHNNKNPEYKNPADSIRGSTSIWAAMDGGIFLSATDTESVMKAQVVLKEGDQVSPFLYSIDGNGSELRFNVISIEADAKHKVSDEAIVDAVEQSTDWSTLDEVAGRVGMSTRRLAPRINALAGKGLIESRREGRGGKYLYRGKGSEDVPSF